MRLPLPRRPASGAAALAIALFLVACSSVTPVVKEGGVDAELSAGPGPADAGGAPVDAAARTADAVAPADVAAADDGGGSVAASCEAAGPATPAWYHEAVGYEIFVRSFQDGDGDGVGDLKGLTSRLDYLNDGDPATDDDLGVTLLWLMPITESPSYHGYDVTDYRAVEPDYGTLADLDALVAAAHQRGIRVITDLVINHSSSQHPWFEDAKSGPGAAHRDWYVWSDTFLDWDRPWGPGPTWNKAGASWYYALFWEGMPDLNYTTPAVRAEMTDVARFWLGHGLDGFRLDAARYLVETGPGAGQADTAETHAFWRSLRAMADTEAPGALLVGEVWEQTPIVVPYYGAPATPEFQMLFDFDTADGIVQAIADRKELRLRTPLCRRLRETPPWAAPGVFLTNHDQERVASALDGDSASLRLAAGLLLGLPGTPWLYYGEEIGMKNGTASGDESKRLPMQWASGAGVGFTTGTPWASPVTTAAADAVEGQTGDAGSLLSLYRRLIRERAALPALSRGATRRVEASGTASQPLVLARTSGEQTVVLVYSFDAAAQDVTVPTDAVAASTLTDRLSGETIARTAGAPFVVPVAPRGFRVLLASP